MPDTENGMPVRPLLDSYIEHMFRHPAEVAANKLPPTKLDHLDETDRRLAAKPAEKRPGSATAEINSQVSWLRNTEYISATSKMYGQKAGEGYETRMGVSIMKNNQLRSLMSRTREQQMEAIEKTFEDAERASVNTLRHPSNPLLTATEMFSVFPNLDSWPEDFMLVTYDEDPSLTRSMVNNNQPKGYEHDLKNEEAIIKPLANEDDPDDEWMAFYTPDNSSIDKLREKRRRASEEDEDEEEEEDNQVYVYNLQRDFSYNISKPIYPFFIELGAGGAFYSRIRNRAALRKKRALTKEERQQRREVEIPTKINLTLRPLTDTEKYEREQVVVQLMQGKSDEPAADGGGGGGGGADDDFAIA
eukprot:jgi/Hompol1/3455/HPOL_001587-RA